MDVRRTVRLGGSLLYGSDGNPGFSSQDVGNGALYRDGLTLLFSISYPRLCRCRRYESKRQEDANIPTRILQFLFSTHKHGRGAAAASRRMRGKSSGGASGSKEILVSPLSQRHCLSSLDDFRRREELHPFFAYTTKEGRNVFTLRNGGCWQ